MLTLEGKVSVITGAGSGIGRATAIAFAQQGSRLVLCDNRADYLDNLISQLSGVEHAAVGGGIENERTSIDIADAAQRQFGRIDVLVSGVGLMFCKDITDVSVEEFDALMA